MLKISGPVGAALFVTATLASANVVFSSDSARADSCAAGPAGAAPAGQHWYYHVNRATRHKCWYLHAIVALHSRGVIRHPAAEAAENVDPAPDSQPAAAPVAASAPPDAPAASSSPSDPATNAAADNAPPAPHVTVLSVKTSTPFVTTTPAPQQNTFDSGLAPAAPQTTLPQAENTPVVAAPMREPETQAAAPQGKADAAFNTSAQIAEATTDAARTKTAEAFILLALVFGFAAVVTALISKIVNIYRRPKISDDPDGAWLRFRAEQQHIDAEAGYQDSEVPFLDPQEQYGLADLHTQEWLDQSAPRRHQSSISPQRNTNFPQQPPNSQTDIGPALRALRQARQS
jgi:hypothetical protein